MPQNDSKNRRGPALNPDELAGLVFDVPCLHCGKNVFTVPYVADVHHVLTCSQCKTETWVLIDQSGGVKYFEKAVAIEKINYLVSNQAPPFDYSRDYTYSSHRIQKNLVIISWNRILKENRQYGPPFDTTHDWTVE